ncbi:hypothetical protein ACOMHN_045028 [Nucella lapillus]
MDLFCKFCGAKQWPGEAPGLCCTGGKVKLPPIEEPPDPLKTLLTGNSQAAKQFQNKLSAYNAAFQMTSFGADKNLTDTGFFTTFKIQGQCYHLMGCLLPLTEEQPKFVQVYFMGTGSEEEAVQRCRNIPSGLDVRTVADLQDMLHESHKYIKVFKYALEQMEQPELKVTIRADKRPQVSTGGQLQLCSQTGPAQEEFEQDQDLNKSVSCKDFYAYHLMERTGFNHLLRFGRVTCQWIVDAYAKIKAERLGYIRRNQDKLRAEEYVHLRDAMATDGADPRNISQPVVLPSSFTGSPRYMAERTQDAMAYVQKFGRPDLFITFTCNPKWDEIQRELFEGQDAKTRHNIISRVFHEKQKKLRWLLKEGQVFGTLKAWMYTIEWQKRGLPHSHTLIWCNKKIQASDIDQLISAELPNREEDPDLFSIISTQMIHGPCGQVNPRCVCMKDNRCEKKFPRVLRKETETGEDGYPQYRRRSPEDGGQTTKLQIRGQQVQIDNQWVVPHNKLLCKIFKAHVNVEFCSSIKAIKYVCKYINKGSDMATFTVEGETRKDEIKTFQTGRYISTNEAVWRIFSFDLHQRYPPVVNLSVHLENGQRVYYTEKTAHQRAQAPPETTLTAFIKLCQSDEFACTLLYSEVPTYFRWIKSGKKWKRYERGQAVEGQEGVKAGDTIGRVYTVHSKNRECFYLRLLLHTVKGPTSFENIRSFAGVVYDTYQEACCLKELLEDGEHWSRTMEEAAATQMPSQLRHLFAILLTTCELPDPTGLWEAHKEDLSEDVLARTRRQNPGVQVEFNQFIYNEALLELEAIITSLGSSMEACQMPKPNGAVTDMLQQEILRETNYNTEELVHSLDTIMTSISNESGQLFFLDAPRGTGKTFLINLILAEVRKRQHITLAIASSGIAATLLDGGRTAHSAFKLPLDLTRVETPACNITKRSAKAKLLQQCKVIIWDKATMSHKKAFEALDQSLQGLRDNNRVMGGVTLIMAGDFRQTLPVFVRGTRADAVNACIKSSNLWRSVQSLTLQTNMRVHLNGDEAAGVFAGQLLQIGNGTIPTNESDKIQLPFGHVAKTEEDFIEKVFPNLLDHFKDRQWLSQRAILAPTNEAVTQVNRQLLSQLPSEEQVYKSVDGVLDEEAIHYPVVFLNALEPAGMPPHKLSLKLGTPVMLLRNLQPPRLCNGTRLTVNQMMPHVLEGTIMAGKYAGEHIFIPRIPLVPSSADLPFEFKRLQFPLRVSFAITINKSQGQSLKVAGLKLDNSVFSHGQLYVGCSRVGNPDNLHILAPEGRTKNIVYPEALRN